VEPGFVIPRNVGEHSHSWSGSARVSTGIMIIIIYTFILDKRAVTPLQIQRSWYPRRDIGII